jgi:hypothetical protein
VARPWRTLRGGPCTSRPLLGGPGCAMLVGVDVDELQHALGGVVLEAAYLGQRGRRGHRLAAGREHGRRVRAAPQPRPRGPAELPRQPAAQELHGGGRHAAASASIRF